VNGQRAEKMETWYDVSSLQVQISRIFLPMFLVEIGSQEESSLALKHRVDARDKFPTVVVLARQMPANRFIGNGKKAALRTFSTLKSYPITDI
jgi:hypothetical protein